MAVALPGARRSPLPPRSLAWLCPTCPQHPGWQASPSLIPARPLRPRAPAGRWLPQLPSSLPPGAQGTRPRLTGLIMGILLPPEGSRPTKGPAPLSNSHLIPGLWRRPSPLPTTVPSTCTAPTCSSRLLCAHEGVGVTSCLLSYPHFVDAHTEAQRGLAQEHRVGVSAQEQPGPRGVQVERLRGQQPWPDPGRPLRVQTLGVQAAPESASGPQARSWPGGGPDPLPEQPAPAVFPPSLVLRPTAVSGPYTLMSATCQVSKAPPSPQQLLPRYLAVMKATPLRGAASTPQETVGALPLPRTGWHQARGRGGARGSLGPR